jgi:hypothetical protein
LLNRLLNKGAIECRKRTAAGICTRRSCSAMRGCRDRARSLLDRLFGGRVAPLVAHFSEQRKLSRKDIADLRKLLEELDDDGPLTCSPSCARPPSPAAPRSCWLLALRRPLRHAFGAGIAYAAWALVPLAMHRGAAAGRAVAGRGRAGHRHAADERLARRR